jgi:hypothetical protein
MTRPTRHHHISDRHKIVFASVTLNAHGSSLIGRSAKLLTPVDRSPYMVCTTVQLLRLQINFAHDLSTSLRRRELTNLPYPLIVLTTTTRNIPLRFARETNIGTKTPWIWRTTHSSHPHALLTPTHPRMTKQFSKKFVLLNAAPKNPSWTHMRLKTTISVSSLPGLLSGQPLAPPANNSRRNTQPYTPRRPSLAPLARRQNATPKSRFLALPPPRTVPSTPKRPKPPSLSFHRGGRVA